MSTILFFIIALVVQAIALKLAIGLLGKASTSNDFSTAIGVAVMLNIAMVVTAFIPIVGWVLKPLVWLLIIMAVYKVGFFKSIAVTIMTFVIQTVLKWLLGLIGFTAIGAS